jgi:hypothetical protein
VRVSIASRGQGGHVDGVGRDGAVPAGVEGIPLATYSAKKSPAVARANVGGDVETGVGGGAVRATGDSSAKGL